MIKSNVPSDHDTIVDMATSQLRYGAGATREIGMELADRGLRRVLVVTDRRMSRLPPVEVVRESLGRERIDFDLYDEVRVEPTDKSFLDCIEVAAKGKYDAFVAVGGGSAIDTAKAANLYSTHPAELMEYVNAPLGQAKPVPGPLKPLFAIPTTAGTGSETTGVAIFDITDLHVKTGIAHRYLKPTLGIIDPDNTRTMPPMVAASTGLDVLCHALESFTAIPFEQRPRPERPTQRPAYQGSNPISDVWSLQALAMVSKYLRRAVEDPGDDEARSNMLLASAYAGMGFGNAGVHLCHGMSYPVSGMAASQFPLGRSYFPPGYPDDHPLVPHGVSVVLTAPAVFRFTAEACPDRHFTAAANLLEPNTQLPGKSWSAEFAQLEFDPERPGDLLAKWLIRLMQELKLPSGLAALGFTEEDLPALAEGTLPQHRVTKLSPRPASEEDLVELFRQSLVLW